MHEKVQGNRKKYSEKAMLLPRFMIKNVQINEFLILQRQIQRVWQTSGGD